MTLIIVADIVAKPGKEDALREGLTRLIAPTLAEPGCVQYVLDEDNARPGHVLFHERWDSREAWDDGHKAAPHVVSFQHGSGDLIKSIDLYEMTRIAG